MTNNIWSMKTKAWNRKRLLVPLSPFCAKLKIDVWSWLWAVPLQNNQENKRLINLQSKNQKETCYAVLISAHWTLYFSPERGVGHEFFFSFNSVFGFLVLTQFPAKNQIPCSTLFFFFPFFNKQYNFIHTKNQEEQDQISSSNFKGDLNNVNSYRTTV